MAYPNTLEVCRSDLFTREVELRQRYPEPTVEKVLRVRGMYNWLLSNPDSHDREFVEEECKRHNIHRTTAYADLSIVKKLLPMLSSASRDFHRWRTNEMLMQAYQVAKSKDDAQTMERAATSYGKLNRVDTEDEQTIPLDQIIPQPFTATDDPRVLGIEPIPNLQQKISDMLDKYRRESMDIEDVSYEEIDLEFDTLFEEADTPHEDEHETSVLQ